MGSQVREVVILGDALHVLQTTANALIDIGEQHPGLEDRGAMFSMTATSHRRSLSS